MVVDALMQIPFLSAIITAVVWVGKTLWELIGRAYRQVVVWLSVWVPWLIHQAARRIATKLLVIGVWLALLTSIWTLVLGLISDAVQWAIPTGLMASLGGWLLDLAWTGPLQLQFAYKNVLPPLLAAQTACWSIRLIWGRVRWAIMTGITRA